MLFNKKTRFLAFTTASLLLASLTIISCQKNDSGQQKDAQVNEKNQEIDRLKSEIKDLQGRAEAASAEATSLKEKQAKDADALAQAEKNRSEMELKLQNLAGEIKNDEARLEVLKKEVQDLTAKKEAIQAELASRETRAKAAEEVANKSQSDSKTALAELEKTKDEVKKAQDALKEAEAKLAQAQSALDKQEAKFKSYVQLTKDLFSKEGLGDIFDKIQKDGKFAFLVSIIGWGDKSFVKEFYAAADRINTNEKYKRYKSAAIAYPKKATKSFADFTEIASAKINNYNGQRAPMREDIIVEGVASEVKKLRDDFNNKLKSLEGTRKVEDISLFVVVRPIGKVRVGMVLDFLGTSAMGYEGRKLSKVASLNKLRRADVDISGLDKVNIADPGSYVFNEGKSIDEKKCEVVDYICLEMLAQSGLLNDVQKIDFINDKGDRETAEMRYGDLVVSILEASSQQIGSDLIGTPLISIVKNIEGFTVKANNQAIQIAMGFGDRAPVIDVITLKYGIKMVDYLNDNGGNHLDAMEFLRTGFINTASIYSAKRVSRNEIEIDLPVTDIKYSLSEFEPVHMKDILEKAKAPVMPSLEGKNSTEAKAIRAKFEKDLETYKNGIASQFRQRIMANHTYQKTMANRISAALGTNK